MLVHIKWHTSVAKLASSLTAAVLLHGVVNSLGKCIEEKEKNTEPLSSIQHMVDRKSQLIHKIPLLAFDVSAYRSSRIYNVTLGNT